MQIDSSDQWSSFRNQGTRNCAKTLASCNGTANEALHQAALSNVDSISDRAGAKRTAPSKPIQVRVQTDITHLGKPVVKVAGDACEIRFAWDRYGRRCV